MIAVVILIVLVIVLSVYSAFGTYQNQQDIKALTDVTKGIGINSKHICKILEMLKQQEPKQVIGIADSIEGMEVGYCPSCDRTIVNKKIDETKFCKFCGQAVKWYDSRPGKEQQR